MSPTGAISQRYFLRMVTVLINEAEEHRVQQKPMEDAAWCSPLAVSERDQFCSVNKNTKTERHVCFS